MHTFSFSLSYAVTAYALIISTTGLKTCTKPRTLASSGGLETPCWMCVLLTGLLNSCWTAVPRRWVFVAHDHTICNMVLIRIVKYPIMILFSVTNQPVQSARLLWVVRNMTTYNNHAVIFVIGWGVLPCGSVFSRLSTILSCYIFWNQHKHYEHGVLMIEATNEQ